MKIFCLIIVLIFFSCRSLQKGHEIDICGSSNFYQTVEKVSFDNIDHIKKLNGKFIEIEGFFYANFEDVALYPSRSSKSTGDALWLNLLMSDSLADKLTKKKVKVIGRVNLTHKGHLNGYLATLDSTFCLKEVVH
jgi:hypothetical protein